MDVTEIEVISNGSITIKMPTTVNVTRCKFEVVRTGVSYNAISISYKRGRLRYL